MSTNFPGALDTLTNPAATDGLTGHAAQHSNANDAIEALQAKVGVDSSAVPTSLDYKVAALASGKEDKASKGVAGGYAGLDGSGKIPSAQLPSYVDDVLEFANLAAFPATGEAAKIYIALDTNKMYRWSGSAYVEIVSSPGTTDSVTEGSTNLYFTYQRVRDTVLTGLSTATNAVIAAGDGVLVALGKLQAQITGLKTGPAFSARRSTTTTVSNSTWTPVVFNSEEFDTAGVYDTATGKFQPNIAGYYFFTITVQASGSTNITGIGAGFYKNKASGQADYYALWEGNAGQPDPACSGNALIYLNGTTDYVTGSVFISGAGTMTILNNNCSFMQGYLARRD